MPAVAFIGCENVAHCSGHVMETGSTNVFVNGIGVVRDGDVTSSHLTPPNVPPCPPHIAQANPENRGVWVNGKLAAVLGSNIAGCTSIAEGSPNTFIG